MLLPPFWLVGFVDYTCVGCGNLNRCNAFFCGLLAFVCFGGCQNFAVVGFESEKDFLVFRRFDFKCSHFVRVIQSPPRAFKFRVYFVPVVVLLSSG